MPSYVFVFLILGLLLPSCSSVEEKSAIATHTKQSGWKQASDELAREFALSSAERYPEAASGLGYREFDGKAVQLEDDMESKDKIYLDSWRLRLNKLLAGEVSEELRTDYQILADKVDEWLVGLQLAEKYNEVPYCLGSKRVYMALAILINPQSPPERKHAAVGRFKAYVEGHGDFKPLLVACESRTRYNFTRQTGKKAFYPLKAEIDEYLQQTSGFVDGIKELLKVSGRNDWTESFKKFRRQVEKHDAFIRREILPKARQDHRLPRDYYVYLLRKRGIRSAPEDLIARSKKDYRQIFIQFQELADEVATKRKIKDRSPAAVIKQLKKNQVIQASEVERLYRDADTLLTKIIKSHELVSLPAAPLRIRLAGPSESKAQPVPHLLPPPLINNQGERPEFVVPTASEGKLSYDDFAYEAAAPVLTAHEGRPGHDLQFSSMLDNGVSIIRARYAANSVNIEGWGLYAEDLVFPHLPLESRFVAVQSRLWRTARAFLDPELILGRIQPKDVIDLYTKELGLSKALAGLEVRRYTYDAPGQAPSYYYGWQKLLESKEKTKENLGAQFNEKCFNDAVLALGLLPVDSIAARLQRLDCSVNSGG